MITLAIIAALTINLMLYWRLNRISRSLRYRPGLSILELKRRIRESNRWLRFARSYTFLLIVQATLSFVFAVI